VSVVEPVRARAPHPEEAASLAATALVDNETGVAPTFAAPVPTETSVATAQAANRGLLIYAILPGVRRADVVPPLPSTFFWALREEEYRVLAFRDHTSS
jgi:hypothetical protein